MNKSISLKIIVVGLFCLLISTTAGYAQAESFNQSSSPGSVDASTVLDHIVYIAAGNYNTCAITDSGAVLCWGFNYDGSVGNEQYTQRSLPVQVTGLTSGYTKVTVGDEHACALHGGDGIVKCWGLNSEGQLGNGSTNYRSYTPVTVSDLSNVIDVSAGSYHTCAIVSGGVVKCWGANWSGQLGNGTDEYSNVPVPVSTLSSGQTMISGGGEHTCSLGGGGIKCWGGNYIGQLGDGTNDDSFTPVGVYSLSSGIGSIESGYSHTCAVTTLGAAKCWGAGWGGQLGNDSFDSSNIPVDVTGLSAGVSAIVAGSGHSCALMTGGGVKCWGDPIHGQIGDGEEFTNRKTPVDVTGLQSGISMISSAQQDTTCALTSGGTIKCWGWNMDGNLGIGETTQWGVPRIVELDGVTISDLDVGGWHSCILTSDGAVKCWGYNSYYQLGNGNYFQQNTPVDVNDLANGVRLLDSGFYHNCVIIDADGTVKCWGYNFYGQLGNGNTDSQSSPITVSGITSGATDISAGLYHSCAVVSGGVKCWGRNDSGQLGNDSTTNSNSPVSVMDLTSGVLKVEAGGYHSCALTDTHGVKCWGRNDTGQLGNNTTVQSLIPVQVEGLTSGVVDIALGITHSCALMGGGGVKCWGDGTSGQLGNNTKSSSMVPVDVTDLSSGAYKINAGYRHTCAVTDAGAVKCWGIESQYELGQINFSDRKIPVTLAGMEYGMMDVSIGYAHTCGLSTNGKVECLGYNGFGQLGFSTKLWYATPQDVLASKDPGILIDYNTGSIGSSFAVTGWGFPQYSNATITLNGVELSSSVQTNGVGNLYFFLDTDGADPGFYHLEVSVNPSASLNFIVADNYENRAQQGGGLVLGIPDGIAGVVNQVFIPLVIR